MSEPTADPAAPAFVSTGDLPGAERVRHLVEDAYERFRAVDDGHVSTVYPALARQRPELWGLCVVGVRGQHVATGDAEAPFTIMSVVKPFVFALACTAWDHELVRERIGVNATGLAFNSVTAVEQSRDGRTNPMVNAGAIATASLLPGDTPEARFASALDGLNRFAGRELAVDEEVYASASATNHRNRSIAGLLQSYERIYTDPAEALDLYTRLCALSIHARDLATMGATLADGGVNPITGVRVVDEETCRHTLAVMTTAGLYETSGDWLYDVGLPGKSGIGGGIVTVAPGKGSLATFGPPLDRAGNSVRGQLAARYLSRQLGLDIFRSAAVVAERAGA